MGQGGKGKKMASLPEKKDEANAALTSLTREAEETNAMMDRMESMDDQELREYMLQKKATLDSEMKATIKKLMQKDKPKKKKKKKRTMLCPIVGATLKFHKDDDVDPAAEAIGAAA